MKQTFSDLLQLSPTGRPRLLPQVHHIPELLDLDTEQLLTRFEQDQERDFRQMLQQLNSRSDPLAQLLQQLRTTAAAELGNRFDQLPLFRDGELEALFVRLHRHVMGHPVWRHPAFVRIFAGDFDRAQLTLFAQHYFNQVKNTRQCVALALGRFSGFSGLPYGSVSERVSELTQIVLAQLLADEYGVSSHEISSYPTLGGLFQSTTHIVMYRRIFEGLGVAPIDQDQPMLHGVADNVLIQRLVAGDPAFSELEALASVGLGMEWGVPEFFSQLLGGMIRFAWQQDLPLRAEHLQVFIAHVQYDVLHAIAVMLVTSFHCQDEADVVRIEQATNMLMAGRYGMMDDLYQRLFGERCRRLNEWPNIEPYRLHDRRIADALIAARQRVPLSSVVEGERYRASVDLPFLFTDQPAQ